MQIILTGLAFLVGFGVGAYVMHWAYGQKIDEIVKELETSE